MKQLCVSCKTCGALMTQTPKCRSTDKVRCLDECECILKIYFRSYVRSLLWCEFFFCFNWSIFTRSSRCQSIWEEYSYHALCGQIFSCCCFCAKRSQVSLFFCDCPLSATVIMLTAHDLTVRNISVSQPL